MPFLRREGRDYYTFSPGGRAKPPYPLGHTLSPLHRLAAGLRLRGLDGTKAKRFALFAKVLAFAVQPSGSDQLV